MEFTPDKVVEHLKNYGISAIDGDKLKYFIKENSASKNGKKMKMIDNICYDKSKPKKNEEDDIISARVDLKKLIKYEERKKQYIEEPDYKKFKHCNKFADASTQTQLIKFNAENNVINDFCTCDKNIYNNRRICSISDANIHYNVSDKENVRPTSNQSGAKSSIRRHYQFKQRKLQCDPVALYQYYQSIWKKHKIPGEDDHIQLRNEIRDRMMGNDRNMR